ncbi:MAG TPA: hypothetical protein VF400_08570 [Anaeromyxobacteraceae bacterium]
MDVRPTLEEMVMEELEPEAVPLEPTCFAPTARPAPVLLPELEPTSVGEVFAALTAALPAASAEPLEWIEPTCQLAVEVDVEALEVERFAPPAHAPAAAPQAGECRYCRAPSAPQQVFCEHCGMHLERSDASPPDEPEAEAVRCRDCGSPATGERCPACGSRLPELSQ